MFEQVEEIDYNKIIDELSFTEELNFQSSIEQQEVKEEN